MARAMTEDELLTAILDTAALTGWRAHHIRRSDLGRQQGAPGLPDLILARAGELLFLELKRAGGKPTPDQWAWVDVLSTVPGVEAEVVWPVDLNDVLRRLSKRMRPQPRGE